MDLLIEKVKNFGLENFINDYHFNLCNKTVSPNRVASALKFGAHIIEQINGFADSFSRNEKLYELIQKKSTVKNFLEALNESGNEHLLEFIENTDFSTASTSATPNPNQSRGIWFNIPEPIDSFCGREDFLSQLHEKLQSQNPGHSAEAVAAGPSRPKVTTTILTTTLVTVLSQVKIVSGLGGIGKTETVTQYIMRHVTSYNNFIWINAESEGSMRNSFLKLADEIKVPVKNPEGTAREIEEIVKEIYNKICDVGKSNLIVFDNAEDYLSCRQFFPFGLHPDLTKPVILATSRNQEWKSTKGKIQVLSLDVMTEDESLEFILKQLEIPESEIPEFCEESKEFIELIGGLPLALQQAVAFIKAEKEERKFLGTPYEISDYVKEFKSSMKKFLTFSPVPPPDSSPTVFVTWNVTFEKIQKLPNGKEAVKILEILSFLYADKIPSTFLHGIVPEIQDAQFSGGLKLLEKYSLIKMNVKDFCLSIHRQLQFVILQYLKECGDVANVLINLGDKCQVILKDIKLSKCTDIFLSLHQIVNNPFDLIPMTEKFVDFLYLFGLVLWEAGRFTESLELYKKVYGKRCELLGENHQLTLLAQHNIALNLSELGRYEEALRTFQENLEKKETHPDLGLDHPDTIATKHNMADLLRGQKKYGESLEVFQLILAQEIEILGENHPQTLHTQNEIALLHLELGNLSEALHLYDQLEEKQAEILGPHHRDVLGTRRNRACVLYQMEKYEEASKFLKEVHEGQKEILGENHLNTIDTLSWIAMSTALEGKFQESLDIHKQVFETVKSHFGEDHPDAVAAKIKIDYLETIV